MKRSWLFVPLLLATGLVLADEVKKEAPKEEPKQDGPKRLEGISILGNQDAPKSLVIVPWKTSELGGTLGISPLLDDSRLPVDREVFLRALSYYEIRSGDATQHAAAAPGRKS
jgi:hypothetical protein